MEFLELFEKDLQPTPDNIEKTLKEDSIGRNEEVYSFVKILKTIKDTSCVIALDGPWGSGKTFFIKQTQKILEKQNIKKNIKFITIYYDSWENDDEIDPILSIIYEIVTKIDSSFKNLSDKSNKITSFLAPWINLATNSSLSALGIPGLFKFEKFLDIFKEDETLKDVKSNINLKESIRNFIDSITENDDARLIFFIDELDRCKPSYSVKLLERIKHYFNNKNCTFVFSVDIVQLQSVLKQYYGNDFDALRYLDRFFDFRMSLPEADINKYFQYIGLKDDAATYNIISIALIKKYNFTLREISRYNRMLKMAFDPYKERIYGFSEEKADSFCRNILTPIIIGLKMHNTKMYFDFINGRNFEPLLEILVETGLVDRYLEKSSSENYRSRVGEIYNVLFVNQGYELIEGMRFYKSSRNKLLKLTNFLSKISPIIEQK